MEAYKLVIMVSGLLKELDAQTVLVRLVVADMSENNGPLRAEHVHYMLNAELQSHKRLDVAQLLCICVLVTATLHTSSWSAILSELSCWLYIIM